MATGNELIGTRINEKFIKFVYEYSTPHLLRFLNTITAQYLHFVNFITNLFAPK